MAEEVNKIIIVEQFLSGEWVELIQLNLEAPILIDEVQAGLKELTALIYENDKAFMTNENESVILQRIDGPIRIKAVDVQDQF